MKDPVDNLAILESCWWGLYLEALVEQQQAELAVTLCAARRAAALARLHAEGWSMAQIADAARLTSTRVWQLITRDRRAVAPVLAVIGDDGDDELT